MERKGENRCRKIDSFFSEAAFGNLMKTMPRRKVFAVGVQCMFFYYHSNNKDQCCYILLSQHFNSRGIIFKDAQFKIFYTRVLLFFQSDYDINASILYIAPSYKRVCKENRHPIGKIINCENER